VFSKMSIFQEPKIDCHNHIFDPASFPYQVDAPYKPSFHEITSADYFSAVMDAYGITNALIVGPNSGYGEDDNRALVDAVARDRQRFKGMAVVSSRVTDKELQALKEQGMVGVTFNIAFYKEGHFAHAESLMKRLYALGMFAQFQFEGDQLLKYAELLKQTPATVVIDHCGRPDVAKGLNSEAFKLLLELGRRTNHYIKLSGMAKFSQEPFPFEDTRPFVYALLQAFGENRVIWGTDWPFLKASQRIDLGALLMLYAQWFPDPTVRAKLFRENAERLFGFAQG